MNSKFSRRDFLRLSALGAAGALITPTTLLGAPADSAAAAPKKKGDAADTLNVAFIGLGQQAMHLLNGFHKIKGVDVVAGCDVYDIKRQRFEQRVNKFNQAAAKKIDLKLYEKYEDVLARPDIDIVVIATPDHQHAVIAIAAARAGKDIYLEKPMTFTVFEGQQLVKAVRENNRILQVGSQQRSSAEFIHTVNLVREGELGKISKVEVSVGAGPKPFDLPTQQVPAGLNWDRWLGPLSVNLPYNEELNPKISLNPEVKEKSWGGWRWYKECGGGYTTDWGAHMFDITQWALGKDRSCPSEIIPPGHSYHKYLTYVYDNGIEVTEQPVDGNKKCVKFYGENGWIQVQRGEILASDEIFMPKTKKRDDGIPFETMASHYQTFIDSVRSRRDPNVPVEVGHSSCTMCTLGNIAYELKRPLKWNPIVEKFVNDPEATKMLHYEYRDGYKL